MDERILKFRVGAMVLATLILLAILVVLFGESPTLIRSYVVHINFPEAPGVTQDTPVRKSGILIGRVTDVRFSDDDQVIVTVSIDTRIRLRRNEVPRITASLLGDAVIQFVPSGGPAKEEFIEDGDLIAGSVARNPLQVLSSLEGDLGGAIGSVSAAGNQIGQLAQNVNRLLASNDEQINRIIGKTENALDGFQQTLANVNSILGTSPGPTEVDTGRPALPGEEQARTNLPEVLKETSEAVRTLRTTLETADRNLRNLEGFTGPLGERGEQIVGRIDQTVARLDELLEQFVEFGTALNRREGSLGQLVNNPDLYQHLNAAACNIEQLTKQLKPIVNDARVFADKIARHPEVLGVRGAIKKSPGIK